MASLRYRNACFTTFDLDIVPSLDEIQYICYQQERCPTTGRMHLQGYVEFKSQLGLANVKRILGSDRIHVEKRRGSQESAIDYCKKARTAVPGTFVEHGVARSQGKRSDIALIRDSIKEGKTDLEIIEEVPQAMRYIRALRDYRFMVQQKQSYEFRHLDVKVYWGDAGTGKTRRVYEEFGHENVFCLDSTDGQLWFDGYRGESCLLLDDFYGGIKYSFFLKLLDGHPVRLPVKGGFCFALWTHVRLTSNDPPDTWYKKGYTPAMSRRIHDIIHLEEGGEA